MTYQPHPKSFPATRLPHLTNLVKRIRSQPPSHDHRLLPKRYPLHIPAAVAATAVPPSSSECLYRDDLCCIVNDAFPKSAIHCLVLPLETSIQSLNDLRKDAIGGTSGQDHVALLKHMKAAGEWYISFLQTCSSSEGGDGTDVDNTTTSPPLTTPDDLVCLRQSRRRRFIQGFHALPSLPMLHMHLMSLDLDSPCLKKKRHYNSFATSFFLPVDDVIKDLECNGRITLNQHVDQLSALEKSPLQCLWCGSKEFSQLPALMSHVRVCPKNRSLM